MGFGERDMADYWDVKESLEKLGKVTQEDLFNQVESSSKEEMVNRLEIKNNVILFFGKTLLVYQNIEGVIDEIANYLPVLLDPEKVESEEGEIILQGIKTITEHKLEIAMLAKEYKENHGAQNFE